MADVQSTYLAEIIYFISLS